MGRFRGVLLATDYDDTLYSTNATISPENRQAIEYFVAEGGKFCISTGRSYINFAIQMEKERLPVNAPVILSNGASIYDFATEKSLWLKHLPPLAPRHLAQVCRAFPQVGFEAYHQDEVFTFRANEVTRHHLTRCHLTGVPRAIEAMPVPWIKVILQHPDPGMLQQVQTYVRTQWPEDYDVTFSNPYLLEVTAKGANKGGMVLRLAERLGIAREDVCCMGDEANDLSMLRAAGHAFAPANGTDAVKAVSTVVSHAESRAVADVVDLLDRLY